MNLNIEIQGLEELQRKTQDPNLIGQPLKELLEDASSIGVKAAFGAIEGGKLVACRSISKEVQPMTARVFSAMPRARALSIEEGRAPGVDPAAILPQIIAWKEAVGHPDSARVIALDISRQGAKGKHFMRTAKEQVEEAMPRLADEMGAKVKARFEA